MNCNECHTPMTQLDPREITDPQPSRFVPRWRCDEKECPRQGEVVEDDGKGEETAVSDFTAHINAEIIEHTYKRLYATYQNHDIVIERKDTDVTDHFYILVIAPSGLSAYDGYWPRWGIESETMDDALTEALAGSGLLGEEDGEAS